MFLQQILDVDEKNQLISVNAWLSYSWQDYKLTWDPAKYDGIENVRFPGTADHIWKPDILLYNSAAEDFDSTYKSNLLVYASGDVNWIPPGVLKFVCKLDVTCSTGHARSHSGSWTSSETASVDLQIADENTKTELRPPALREVKYYKCCPEPYPTVKYFLHLRRRTLYYGNCLQSILPY
ncbi:Neurotransmitter-gated ion-channel ligand binding domain protein [Cooperia oncophora]